MRRSHWIMALVIAVGMASTTAHAQRRGRGGGGFGRGGFGGGNMNDWFQRFQQDREKDRQERAQKSKEESEKKTREKVSQHLAEGWQNLKAGALPAAVEAFTDALELKPDTAEARLGIGLARSADGQFTAAQKQFDLAVKAELPKVEQPKPKPATKPANPNNGQNNNQPGMNRGQGRGFGPPPGGGFPGGIPGFGKSPEELAAEAAQAEAERIEASKVAYAKADSIRRLAQYNLAVLYTRQNIKPKAVIALHTVLSTQKPGTVVDEMVINAQRSLLFGQLDDNARKGIGLLTQINKTLTDLDKALAVTYPGQERYGITWVPIGAGSQLRAAGKVEPYVAELPFVLPDGTVLKGKKAGAVMLTSNTLLPDVAKSLSSDLLASAGVKPAEVASSAQPAATATVPGPVASGTTARPIERPVLAKPGTPGGDASATPGTPAEPMTPAAPAPSVTAAPIEAAVTYRGAAFCVAPGVLVTCARHVQGATSITVTDTDDMAASADILAIDEASGFALLRTTGNFKPMRLADAAKPGPVHVACFAKASLFNPDLEVLKGDLLHQPGKPLLVRLSTHPRSAGAPVFDDQGRVVAVVSATRDDPVGALPALPVEALRKLIEEKVGASALSNVSASVDPDEAVGELRAVRKEVVTPPAQQ